MSDDSDLEIFSCTSSDDDQDDRLSKKENVHVPELKKRKISSSDWTRHGNFASKDEALKFIKNEKSWEISTTHKLTDGYKVYYYCKQRKSQNCLSALHIEGSYNNSDVILWSATLPHSCKSKTKLTEEHKEVIKNFVTTMNVTKPKLINDVLKKNGLPELKTTIITNYTQRLKAEIFHPIKSYEAVSEWCETHAQNCEPGLDTPVILGHEIITNTTSNFLRVVISSRRLLSIASLVECVHADATYKLNLFGFPVIIVGSTDRRRHFHPLAISVCRNEKAQDYEFVFRCLKKAIENELNQSFSPTILIGDAAESITNGFLSVFGESFVRVFCWFHVTKNLVKKLKELKINEKTRKEILDDIRIMQRSQNSKVFDSACNLFAKKWSNQNDFVVYFFKNWVKKNSGWTAGTAPGFPVTNNALESVNNRLKEDYTLRQKLGMKEFMETLLQIVTDWSSVRNPESPNFKNFFTTVDITNDLKSKGASWRSTKLKLIMSLDKMIFYSPSSEYLDVTSMGVKDYEKRMRQCSWNNFDEYEFDMKSIWVITYDPNDWLSTTCSCPIFKKEYVCKHFVGIGIKNKKIEFDSSSVTKIIANMSKGRPKSQCIQPVEESSGKRPKGRPRKITPALQFDGDGPSGSKKVKSSKS